MADEDEIKTNGATHPTPVYVPWATFKSEIMQKLSQIVLPNQIDRSVFSTQSGGAQAGLMAALKFLGLVADDKRPTDAMVALTAADEDDRKRALAKILRDRYAPVFAIKLESATARQLQETMDRVYGTSADTRDKAIRFLLNAAEYAGISYSRLLDKATSSAGAARAKRPRKTTSDLPPVGQASGEPEGESVQTSERKDRETNAGGTGTTRSVELTSGGTVTLNVSVDLFDLDEDDHKFVFDLIKKIKDYGNRRNTTAEKATVLP